MREGLSRRSFLAALVAAQFGWLEKRRAAAPAVVPNPPPPPAPPLTCEAPLAQVTTYIYTCGGFHPPNHCCGLPGCRATPTYGGQDRLG